MKKLGLVTNSGAVRLKHEAESHSDVDLDCQIVAVEGPITGEPLHSPRTTRSLMSQLSRESAEAAKRRLSLYLDSEDASENEFFDSAAARRTTQGSLLAIDFSSPLGQRLKKHMKGDLVVPPIANLEQYCLDRMQDDRGAKLRHRAGDYPVMTKKRKGIVSGYSHVFKFNHVERREFVKTLQTGLNTRSRRLQELTKKCAVVLTRLRMEEIRRWTIRRRTIVNQEITIDDDLSITQVDVPEDMFNTVQKMPVIAHNPELYRQTHFEMKYKPPRQGDYSNTMCGMGASVHQHPGLPNHPNPNLVPHTSYPYPISCVRTSPTGPPQFLVKQVNKNWMENGQESQKLVYVPLEEMGPSTSIPGPNRSVRGLTAGSAQRPSNSSSSGIQKSLPRHLRPCPKSRRKQLVPEREDSSSEEIIVETCSSSSGEDQPTFRSKPEEQQKPQSRKDAVYPLSISRAVGNFPAAPWMVTENPVPQMLHIANSPSSATSVPVSSELVPFPADVVPVSLLPLYSQSSFGKSVQQNPVDDPEQVMPTSSASVVRDNHSELRKQLSMFNLTPTVAAVTLLPKPLCEISEDKNRIISGAKLNADSFPQLSIGAVYSAADLSNEQLAASLGLECTQTPAQRQAAALRQPNFLQPDHRNRFDAGPQDLQPCTGHRAQQPSTQQHPRQSDTSQHDRMPLKCHPPQHLALPMTQQGKTLLHQQPLAKNSCGHQPSILRGPGRLQSPPAPAPRSPVATAKPPPPPPLASRSPPQGAKPSSAQVRSSIDWTVVRASDDDVVEVICIDDDD